MILTQYLCFNLFIFRLLICLLLYSCDTIWIVVYTITFKCHHMCKAHLWLRLCGLAVPKFESFIINFIHFHKHIIKFHFNRDCIFVCAFHKFEFVIWSCRLKNLEPYYGPCDDDLNYLSWISFTFVICLQILFHQKFVPLYD